MSRIGKKPITIEPEVTVTYKDGTVQVAGPKGQLDIKLPKGIIVTTADKQLELKSTQSSLSNLAGLFRSLIQNAITGVKTGWTKTLELVGVGFRGETSGNELILNLGFSHPVKIVAPPNISFQVTEGKITVSGIDKYVVGEVAAKIRKIKPPEPYKVKGIRYTGEYIRKKLGKAAKAVGGVGTK